MASWRILIADGLAEEGQAILRRQAEIVEASDLAALPRFDGLIVRSRPRVSPEPPSTSLLRSPLAWQH